MGCIITIEINYKKMQYYIKEKCLKILEFTFNLISNWIFNTLVVILRIKKIFGL